MAHLPLGREVAVAGRDTKQKSVKVGEVGRRKDRVVRLVRGVHLRQHLIGEGLCDPVQ
jgi:hypothetical protein